MENKSEIKVKFALLKPDAIVPIKIGVGFYQRLQNLMYDHYNQIPLEEAAGALTELASGKDPKNAWEYHLVTLMTLLYELEVCATENGLIEDRELTPSES